MTTANDLAQERWHYRCQGYDYIIVKESRILYKVEYGPEPYVGFVQIVPYYCLKDTWGEPVEGQIIANSPYLYWAENQQADVAISFAEALDATCQSIQQFKAARAAGHERLTNTIDYAYSWVNSLTVAVNDETRTDDSSDK